VPYGATFEALARLAPKSWLVAACLAAAIGGTANAAMPASALERPAHAAEPSYGVEPLDLATLAKRLRKTKALNLRAKLAVKNESDDLLEQFRAYHAEAGTTTLSELRRSYDALVRKLCSLLEESDPPLAYDLDRSRAAIWAMLVDPERFETSASAAPANVARTFEAY
jgi:hypothetical protein